MNRFLQILKMPQARRIVDLDAPETSIVHASIIRGKPFLRNLYVDFYNQLRGEIEDGVKGKVVVELTAVQIS